MKELITLLLCFQFTCFILQIVFYKDKYISTLFLITNLTIMAIILFIKHYG